MTTELSKNQNPSEDDEYHLNGEIPMGDTPGFIGIDNIAHPKGLVEAAKEHLKDRMHIVETAEKLRKQVVPFYTAHGRGILIGMEVASVVIAAGITAYAIRKRRSRKGNIHLYARKIKK